MLLVRARARPAGSEEIDHLGSAKAPFAAPSPGSPAADFAHLSKINAAGISGSSQAGTGGERLLRSSQWACSGDSLSLLSESPSPMISGVWDVH